MTWRHSFHVMGEELSERKGDVSMIYDYGPDIDFSIRNIGAMFEHNGSYDCLDQDSQYLIQAICHMIYQIKDNIRPSENSILSLGGVWIQWMRTPRGEEYSLYTDDMMTVFHIIETGDFSYDIEFLSPNQFRRADSFINYAFQHAQKNGKAGPEMDSSKKMSPEEMISFLFKSARTEKDRKTLYRLLAKLFHPDNFPNAGNDYIRIINEEFNKHKKP